MIRTADSSQAREMRKELEMFRRWSKHPKVVHTMLQKRESNSLCLEACMNIRKALRRLEERARAKKAVYTPDDFELQSLVDWVIFECGNAQNGRDGAAPRCKGCPKCRDAQ